MSSACRNTEKEGLWCRQLWYMSFSWNYGYGDRMGGISLAQVCREGCDNHHHSPLQCTHEARTYQGAQPSLARTPVSRGARGWEPKCFAPCWESRFPAPEPRRRALGTQDAALLTHIFRRGSS